MAQINSLGQRGGAMTGTEVLTGNLEFYTIFTTLDITATGDYSDDSQKDFESVIQVIGLRSMPVLMNEPVFIDGIGGNTLDAYGAPSLSGQGYILRFSFEHTGAHTLETLQNELHGIVLNGGVIDTLNTVNMEFTKQELL